MANMLRGKFRDKIRTFFLNSNQKKKNHSNLINKETKKNISTVILNNDNSEKIININIQKKNCQSKDTTDIKGIGDLRQTFNVKLDNEQVSNKNSSVNVVSSNSNVNNIEIIENKILTKVENIINDYKNKLEIISTDIYVLNNYLEDNKTKEKCKEEKEQIKNIIEKINKIKEQYKILKSKNIELEYLEIDNSLLIDDIYEYKNLVNNITDISKYQDKFKKLEVFVETNSLLETIETNIKKLEKSNKDKMDKINIDEEKLNKIKDELFRYDNEFNRFNNFIENQNSVIDEMEKKVGKIDSYEKTITKFIGYDHLLFNNLKYVSLLLLSPLKGMFPIIATSTLATKSTIDLLMKQAHIEKRKKIVYTAEDYEKQITTNIYNVNDMDNLISMSIDDLKQVKEKLKQNKSLSNTFEYKNVMEKIENIETILNANKNKLKHIQKKLTKYKKINNDKLVKVRKLNES